MTRCFSQKRTRLRFTNQYASPASGHSLNQILTCFKRSSREVKSAFKISPRMLEYVSILFCSQTRLACFKVKKRVDQDHLGSNQASYWALAKFHCSMSHTFTGKDYANSNFGLSRALIREWSVKVSVLTKIQQTKYKPISPS